MQPGSKSTDAEDSRDRTVIVTGSVAAIGPAPEGGN